MKILNSTVSPLKITAITPKELEFLTAIDASAEAAPEKVSRQTRHVAAVKAAGGSRRTFLLSADATADLERWKAHTGAASDREAVELALLAAVLRVGGAA